MRVGMFTYGMGDHLTGIGIYTRQLCLALSNMYPDMELVLINPYQVENQPFFSLFDNYHVPLLKKLPSVLGAGPFILPRIAKKLGLHILHDPCGISPFLRRRGRNEARRVVTIHDTVPYVFPQVQPFLTHLTFRTFIPLARRNVDAVLTPSECSRRDLIQHVGFSEHQVHLSYPGVPHPTAEDILRIQASAGEVLRKWNLSQPFFLYVGALNPRKNVPALISSFEKVIQTRSDAKLVLVGPNTWWADDTLKAAKRLQQSVLVTGYVDDRELACLYAKASALVYPSIYEGFGLPPLEAMSYGTPVITSNVSSLPEVVGDAGLMVDLSDSSSLTSAMLHCLQPEVADTLARKGLERSQRFRWENTAKETFRVYEEIVSSS